MTQTKKKQIELIYKLDPSYEDRSEELENMSMLDILNIKMKLKKNIKNRKDINEGDEEEEEWSLVTRIGCIN